MPKSCPSRPPLALLLLSSSLFLLHLHRWISNSNPIELQLEETVRRSLTTGGTIHIDTSRTIALQHCPCKRSVLEMRASKTFVQVTSRTQLGKRARVVAQHLLPRLLGSGKPPEGCCFLLLRFHQLDRAPEEEVLERNRGEPGLGGSLVWGRLEHEGVPRSTLVEPPPSPAVQPCLLLHLSRPLPRGRAAFLQPLQCLLHLPHGLALPAYP